MYTDIKDNGQLLFPHGGCRKLKSFQLAQLCFDITVRFVELYIPKNSRTIDQMVQMEEFRTFVQNSKQHPFMSVSVRTCPLHSVIVANAVLWLLNVACHLLDRQLVRLAADFENNGGFSERMYKRRLKKKEDI